MDSDRMRRLLGVVATEYHGISADADIHPVKMLDGIAAKSPAMARKGLRMAIGDVVEQFANTTSHDIAQLDARLREIDAMTLSEARQRFSRRMKAIVRRRVIENENDYYLVRNAVEFAPESERTALWQLLADFEAKAAD